MNKILNEQKTYTQSDLVWVAGRENNSRRPYLLVNPLQGKHVPADPLAVRALYSALAGEIASRTGAEERVLVIGFAETATAVGAGVAAALPQETEYIQTTREDVTGAEYLYFSEVHSHATEQKLVKDGLIPILRAADRVIFVDDEVTTGNTILNLIRELEKECGPDCRYAIASFLNGMEPAVRDRFRKDSIELFYLLETENQKLGMRVDRFAYDGEMQDAEDGLLPEQVEEYQLPGAGNTRRAVEIRQYQKRCEALAEKLFQTVPDSAGRVLVLGTEELMYPALITASRLQTAGREVRFHATTRSPIRTSREEDYPLHSRYRLNSLYEEGRTTFVYNLAAYDQVLVLTDAAQGRTDGMASLLSALKKAGNDQVKIFWLVDTDEKHI